MAKGEEVEGRMSERLLVRSCKQLYVAYPLYSTGNYIQSPMIKYNKRTFKMYIYNGISLL